MTEHLPECPVQTKDSVCRCIPCICDALRACEIRALDAAVQRVEALPHSLECVTRDANYSRPCNCLRGDALDAIKGEQ
jgi:hypothetical protein